MTRRRGGEGDKLEGTNLLAPDLVQSYLAANYVSLVDGNEVVLKIGEVPPTALGAQGLSWAVITARNPYSALLSEQDNQLRQALLTQVLSLHGYETRPAEGRSIDGSWQEPGLLVIGISREMAKSLGASFQQNAVLYCAAVGPIELVFCDKER